MLTNRFPVNSFIFRDTSSETVTGCLGGTPDDQEKIKDHCTALFFGAIKFLEIVHE
tara:strand:+ start:5259 stop:5426 length:168 start_codon:yes stop_codon:yes gene_type:complete